MTAAPASKFYLLQQKKIRNFFIISQNDRKFLWIDD